MGANIAELFRQMANMTDEEIAEVHPEHNRNSIKSLLPRLHYYQVDKLSFMIQDTLVKTMRFYSILFFLVNR